MRSQPACPIVEEAVFFDHDDSGHEVRVMSAAAKMIRPMLEAAKRAGKPTGFHRQENFAITAMYRPDKKNGQARNPVWPIRNVVGEALRLTLPLDPPAPEPGKPEPRAEPDPYLYCSHLKAQGLAPEPPKQALWGKEPAEVLAWYEEHKARAAAYLVGQQYTKNWRGHTVRMPDPLRSGRILRIPVEGPYSLRKTQASNVPTAIGHVSSFPRAADAKDRGYREWKRRCVRTILRHYGQQNVVTIVEHTDERYGHIHAIIARPDGGPVSGMMACVAARNAAERRGEPSNTLGDWFRKGGRAFQNYFWKHVGRHLGWLHPRANPDKAPRMSDDEIKIRKQLEAEVQAIDDTIARDRAEIAAGRQELDLRFDGVALRERLAGRKVAELNAMQQAMQEALQRQERAAAEAERDRHESARLLEKVQQRERDVQAAESMIARLMGQVGKARRDLLKLARDLRAGNHLRSGEYEEIAAELGKTATLEAAVSRSLGKRS